MVWPALGSRTAEEQNTSPQITERSSVMLMIASLCLSDRERISETARSSFVKGVHLTYLWPWLGPPQAMLRALQDTRCYFSLQALKS